MSDTSDDEDGHEVLPPTFQPPPPPVIHYRDQFVVAPPPPAPPSQVAAPASLLGDKMLLPPSALEALLSAASSSSSSSSSFSLPQRDGFDALPQPLTFKVSSSTAAAAGEEKGRFVYAGIQEFSADEGHVVLSPYLQAALFGDEDVDVDVVAKENRLTVEFAPLLKGTFVHLRPLAAGYNPADWRPLLERQLRGGYTTLTRGTVFTVPAVGSNEAFRFRVDGFKPAGDGICVVDTDLEVDIEALDEEQARETMRVQESGGSGDHDKEEDKAGASATSSGGDITIWKPVSGQVRAGDYVDYTLASWDRSRPLSISLSGMDGGGNGDDDDTAEAGYAVDLLVSPFSARYRVRPRDTEHVWANFAVADADGTKTVVLPPSESELEGAEALYVTVHGWGEANSSQAHPFTLRVRTVLEEEGENATSTTESTPSETGTEQCANCRQWVPSRSIVLHDSFCRRNNSVCPTCHCVFQTRSAVWTGHWHCAYDPEDGGQGSSPASQHKHNLLFHPGFLSADLLYTCPAATCAGTGVMPPPFTSLPELARHRTTTCPAKLHLCQFCQLEVPQEGDATNAANAAADAAATRLTGQTPHERADGARTTDCYLCGAIVRMRDMRAHLQHHDLDRQRRAAPAICRDVHCGRTLFGVGPRGQVKSLSSAASAASSSSLAASLKLCSACYAPLYVSMHDPDGRALRRRVERRYVTQLLTGCGKSWCANAWCKTGRANQKMTPIEGGTATILPLVKPLVADVFGQDGSPPTKPVFFCVDQETQKRRAVAELLVAQSGHGYDLAWCVAACEAEGADAGKAWEWLASWAPRVTDGV